MRQTKAHAGYAIVILLFLRHAVVKVSYIQCSYF